MKKLIFTILALGIFLSPSKSINGAGIEVNGGSGGKDNNNLRANTYPDWVVDGTFTGVNSPYSYTLKFKSLDLDGDLYILNTYTIPE